MGLIIGLVIVGVNFTKITDSLFKEDAYEFKVDGEVWFIVSDREKLDNVLEEYKKQYINIIDKNAEIKELSFQQKVEINPIKASEEEFSTLDEAKKLIYAKEKEATYIEVKKGDNLWNLSREHKITLEELEMYNPDIDPEKIWPGDKLIINPMNPKLDVIIKLQNTIHEAIPFETEYVKDKNQYQHQKTIVKEGIDGEKEVTYDIVLVNGLNFEVKGTKEKILKEPVKRVMKVGQKTTVSRGGRANYGVVNGKRISSRYGYRTHPITGRRSFHTGLDIAATYGNGVYAYGAGTVIHAGWSGSYGRSVVISHGNGFKTRYAHLSKIYVSAGKTVNTGERIGAVGSTGLSTGAHLHFEVILNGKTKNPLNYL